MVSVITPAIMMIRIERIIDSISINNNESAIKLCRKYVDDLKQKSVSIITEDEAELIAQQLFEIELLIILGLMRCAEEEVKKIHYKIIKLLTNYNILRNRIMSTVSNKHTIGELATLPNDCLENIVERLQVEYVW